MKREFRSAVIDVMIVLLCGALLITVLTGVAERRAVVPIFSSPYIVIDAGHGGADGGAVAADGTEEKFLNLAVAQCLRDLLAVMGFRVGMTRTDDVMIATEGTSLRERKVSDMRNRLARIEEADLAISIHQNKFPQTQYHGAQVFYSVNHADSCVLAESVRTQIITLVQPENTRALKTGDSSVFLLHRTTRPMILVECGFLSNTGELEKLKSSAYQQSIAFAIAAGTVTMGG